MRKIRVLVVDDSAVMRRLLSEAIASDPEFEVAGTAPNGKIALDKLAQVCPDAVTLDVDMPEMDGLTVLPLIRARYPKLPVFMFSALTPRGAANALEALARGASDCIAKPSCSDGSRDGITAVKLDLLPKIRAFCVKNHAPTLESVPKPRGFDTTRPKPKKPAIVAIGVSTGGPNALAEVFAKFPADFPVPIVVVQHMPPVFTRYLAERLNAASALSVAEATDSMTLEPGKAYVAPGNFHLSVTGASGAARTRLDQGPQENSCRPAVDVLFRSVAEVYGPACLGVVLTGMGHDGLRGSQAIRDAGGRILAQDEATSVVWGMPGAVVKNGLADSTLPLHRIAEEIDRIIRSATPSLSFRP
jgi:two-component system chemotaxis response regulator CheB